MRAPNRLREIYEHVGYRVRLLVERKDGHELSPHDRSVIPAIVAGYEADEHRPEVTAADVNILEELPKLEAQELAAKKAQTPKKTTRTKNTAINRKRTPRRT